MQSFSQANIDIEKNKLQKLVLSNLEYLQDKLKYDLEFCEFFFVDFVLLIWRQIALLNALQEII